MKNCFVLKKELFIALQNNQIYKIMRITTFLLMVCAFCSYAKNTHSQNARVNLNKSNVRLNEILTDIESQTDYLFIYNNQVNVNQVASVKARQKPVSEVLDKLLGNTDIVYVMEGMHIVLSRRTSTTGQAVQQQARTIKGTVLDGSGVPVIGANILIKGTARGVISDIDGNFVLEADGNAVLEVSYIGYLKKEVPVNNRQDIRIVLQEDSKAHRG